MMHFDKGSFLTLDLEDFSYDLSRSLNLKNLETRSVAIKKAIKPNSSGPIILASNKPVIRVTIDLILCDIKVKTQYRMFEKMCTSDIPLYLNFDEALETAREIIGIK